MNTSVSSFLAHHNFVNHVDVLSVAQAILDDMSCGLRGEKADEDMIKTFSNPPTSSAKGKSVIVIDAGGTNFRSCLVTFDNNGLPSISEMEKTKMPGVEKELSRKEFFEQFAVNLEHLKNTIPVFCNCHRIRKTEADSVSLVLKEHGWNDIKRITLCNDTVAALLAGASLTANVENFSSYIGFILGTGMNAAYVQPACEKCGIKKQIIVCESGKVTHVNQSDFDKAFDKTTVKPGTFLLEKICSGAYLGPVSWYALEAACDDGLFTDKVAAEIKKLPGLTLIELDQYLHNPRSAASTLGKILAEKGSEEDYDRLFQILDAIVERSARYAAAILTACVIKTGEGKNASRPVCILCDGTTFHKTHMIKERVNAYLDEILTKNMGLYWKIVSCDNDITLGAAIAGLID